MTSVSCALCARECVPSDFTTGYGTLPDGRNLCYACMAVGDALTMEATGRATLYLASTKERNPDITNWPGTLRFRAFAVLKGRHNIAGTRYDVYFRVNGAEWHGVQYGENTQILHCKRTKVRFNHNGYPLKEVRS